MLRKLFAFSAVVLAFAACSSKSSLGSGDGNLDGTGGSGAGGGIGWDPCGGKACGAECSECAANDPNCAETAVLKYCASDGSCNSAYPVCDEPTTCTDDSECPAIGAPCEVCPDGTAACPFSKCENGQCVAGFETCQGQTCVDDSECPAVGAPCQQCPDGTIACPFSACENGQCVGGFPGCGGYDPCGDKSCGDACTQCPPNDPNCVETAVLKYCDAAGQCDSAIPVCNTGTCKTDLDCPGVGACPPCADGSCSELKCVNGACEFQCSAPPNPECKVASDCAQVELCLACSDGSCANIDCVNGSCQFVCGL